MNPKVVSILFAVLAVVFHSAHAQWGKFGGFGKFGGLKTNFGGNLGVRSHSNEDQSSEHLTGVARQAINTMTCVGRQMTGSGYNVIAVTIKEEATSQHKNNFFPYFKNFGQQKQLKASILVRSRDINGALSLAITERSRDGSDCSTDGVGELIRSKAQRQPFGLLGFGLKTGLNSHLSDGVLREIDIMPGEVKEVEIAANLLPFSKLRDYAGRGVALCEIITPVGDLFIKSNKFGSPVGNVQQINRASICEGKIPLCCKLGYDTANAMP